uniref:dihydropyrimidinase n=1 Tax=Tetraselmis sp. GSL018 TaxID=582737 RepID=A0A061QLQ7_9CHLO
MSPPIRSEEHGPALKNALASGVLQIVATDHAVFNSTQKAVGKDDFRKIPNGVNGIEERMHVVWEEMVVSGLMSPMEFVRATSTAAAQVFNIYPRKGIIAPGSDADIIILDPSVEHTISASKHHSRMDTNVYEGKIIHGKVVTTISRGRIVWENNTLRVEPGTGRFIPMKPFGPLFDGLDDLDKTLFSKFSKYGTTPVSRSAYETARDEL